MLLRSFGDVESYQSGLVTSAVGDNERKGWEIQQYDIPVTSETCILMLLYTNRQVRAVASTLMSIQPQYKISQVPVELAPSFPGPR